VIYGESLDVLSSIKPNFTKKDLELTHYLKTASYTVEGPLHLGAILAGATNQQLQTLSKYAIPLGKAFQLQDDILGLFGDEKKLGKPVASDIKEGKKTLLILKALEKASEHDKTVLKASLNNQNVTKEDIQKVRDIVTATNSLEHSQNTAKKLIKQAKQAITNLPQSESKQFLIELADYMLERTI
jgi:geranylgeranyl diphosphate synthase type I